MIHVYADDVQLYFGFKLSEQKFAEKRLENMMEELGKWMDESFLKLNKDKTMIKIFKQRSESVPSFSLFNENQIIKPSSSVKLLGIELGEGKLFNKFITKKITTCNLHLRNLKTVRHCLPQKTKILVFNSLIIPKLDYCNILLLCSPKCDLIPLQRVLNRGVRYIFNLKFTDRTSPYLFKLHVLPINFRVKFKACLLAYKIVNKLAPDYLMNMFSMFDPTCNMELRQTSGRDSLMFKETLQENKTLTLSSKLKKEWNNLPLEIRKLKTLNSFKSNLKTLFFRQAFAEFL